MIPTTIYEHVKALGVQAAKLSPQKDLAFVAANSRLFRALDKKRVFVFYDIMYARELNAWT